jgi:hypothetical protein
LKSDLLLGYHIQLNKFSMLSIGNFWQKQNRKTSENWHGPKPLAAAVRDDQKAIPQERPVRECALNVMGD